MSSKDSPYRLSGPPATLWHIEVLEALRQILRTWPPVFPRKVGDPIVPLDLMIEHRLVGRLVMPDFEGIQLIRATMRRYCASGQYLAALNRDGAMRHTLAGRPIGPVSEEDRMEAYISLEKLRELALSNAPPKTTETIMVQVKALKITTLLPPDQLQPSTASAIQINVATPDGAKAVARITGKAYRRALSQIAALGPENVVVILQGSIRKPGEIEGAGISVQPRKPPAEADRPTPETDQMPEPAPASIGNGAVREPPPPL